MQVRRTSIRQAHIPLVLRREKRQSNNRKPHNGCLHQYNTPIFITKTCEIDNKYPAISALGEVALKKYIRPWLRFARPRCVSVSTFQILFGELIITATPGSGEFVSIVTMKLFAVALTVVRAMES